MTEKKKQPEKLDLRSHTIAEDKKQELLQLFPEIRTEGGKIDFERLKLALGETVDVGRERYGMNWPGKADCFKTIQQPSMGTLLPCKEESVDFDTTENMIIEGDNLEVLKLLQKSYLGKIKMIYIDPPYNTGNDFIYPDNYTESLQTYLEYTGQVDNEGRKFSTNTEADGRFHSKWVNMMYPRLFLARNLLKEDGVLFVSSDDTEYCNLIRICDEIFGEENRIETLVWKRRATAPNDRIIGKNHEYIAAYAKNIEVLNIFLQPRDEESLKRYSNPDNDPNGPWAASDLSANGKGGRLVESCVFPILNPVTNKEYYPPKNKCWLFNKDKTSRFLKEKRIGFREKTGTPFLKRYLSEVRAGVTLPTIVDSAGYSQDSAREIKDIFETDVFEFPKPVELLKKLCICGLESTNDIVLDFFAGSGTTAHALLDQNKQDNGNRKFILVQLPELTGRNDLKTVADITKERVRRAITKIKGEQLSMFDAVKPPLDLGFKVFKLSESNFKTWNPNVTKDDAGQLVEQLEAHIDHIKQGCTQEDILYEILLKYGFPLSTKIETLAIAEKTVYSIAEGAMLICLERNLTHEIIKGIADKKPMRVVCLDEGFSGNDQLKTNAVQTMKAKGVVSFRTV